MPRAGGVSLSSADRPPSTIILIVKNYESPAISLFDMAQVKDRLQGLGVGEPMAKDRVAAMTDQEVHAVAQKIDSMPAGGRLDNNDLTLILLIVLLILII